MLPEENRKPKRAPKTCTSCNGSGSVDACSNCGLQEIKSKCSRCGEQDKFEATCKSCGGIGKTSK